MRTPPAMLLLAGAGLSWTTAQAVLPDMGTTLAGRFAAVSAHRGTEALATALLMVAGALLVLSSMSLARVIAGRGLRDARGGRFLVAGTALVGLGGIWLVGGRAMFNVLFLSATHPDLPASAGMAVLEVEPGVEMLPLLLTLPALLLGPVLLGVGVRRARLATWLPVVLWVLGIGTFLASEFTSKVGETAGIGVAAVALTMLGRAVGQSVLELHDEQRAPVVPAAVDR